MTRPPEVARLSARVGQRPDGGDPVAADTPVPVLTWLTGMVKAVRCASVFSIDISGSRSSSRRPDSIGTQTMPVPV